MFVKTMFSKIKNITNSPVLFLLLCFFYPLVFLIQVNSHLYSTKQIIVTIFFMFIIFLGITLILAAIIYGLIKIIMLLVQHYRSKNIQQYLPKLYRALLCTLGILILLLMLHKTNRDLLPMLRVFHLSLLYLSVAFLTAVLTYKYQVKLPNIILGTLLAVNIAGIIIQTTTHSLEQTNNVIEQNIVFKKKPNIYLVILESYTSLDQRKKIYGINNDLLNKELLDKQYTVYKAYANYATSLPSVASLFMMDHHYYKLSRGNLDGYYRNIIGGEKNNSVIKILLKNGYRIDFNKMSPYLYTPSKYVESQLVKPLLEPIEVIRGFYLFFIKFYSRIVNQYHHNNKILWLPELLFDMPVKKNIIAPINDQRPVFYAISAGANHAHMDFNAFPDEIKARPGARNLPLWKLNRIDDYWIKRYKELVVQSDEALIELIRRIDKNDPEAIVVLLGDHGPLLYIESWKGTAEDLNENIIKNKVTPADVTSDYFDVFLAIKWPTNINIANDYISSVNLMRLVFTVLANDPSLIKSRVRDDSFIYATHNRHLETHKPFYTIKDGRILERWAPYP